MSNLSERELRSQFFELIFGEHLGYICIASDAAVKGDFKQRFFQWPIEEDQLLTHIHTLVGRNRNVWFGVNLLKKRQRKKEFCTEHNLLWADLDTCLPDKIDPRPQIAIESSTGRYQAIWRLDQDIDPKIAEDYSRRIAYSQSANGADISGWDLTQLLRVPFTRNVKPIYTDKPYIKLLTINRDLLPTELFDVLSERQPTTKEDKEFDDSIPEPLDAETILAAHMVNLRKTDFKTVWEMDPTKDDDWSKLMWRLLLCCFEAGLNKRETYSVAFVASVNKYKRDNRPNRYLWKEVNKAYASAVSLQTIADSSILEMPELIPGDDYKFKDQSFIDEYLDWGIEATDASPEYHELSAFILLSSLLAANLKLPTSWGTIRPNLWGLILGDSTLSRKSTALNMTRDIIDFIDRDILIATDGSSEGILQGIGTRPGRTTMYYRDEVVGLFKEIANKQYLAGIPQMFTILYDGGTIVRRLRKELVSVVDPIFIFFGGGIKDQFFESADDDLIHSGFMPRFLIVSAKADVANLRRLGPPTDVVADKKKKMYEMSHELYRNYATTNEVQVLGQTVQAPASIEVELTADAWELYNDILQRMNEAADESDRKSLAAPTFERLTGSMLKMAMLIAASRQLPDDAKIQMEVDDIRRAASYVQRWGVYTIEVMLNLGINKSMRSLDRVRKYIDRNPEATRSRTMQVMNLNKKQMQDIEETLEARGEIRVEVNGRGRTYTRLW